jgi:hypothetical protein
MLVAPDAIVLRLLGRAFAFDSTPSVLESSANVFFSRSPPLPRFALCSEIDHFAVIDRFDPGQLDFCGFGRGGKLIRERSVQQITGVLIGLTRR